MKSKKLTREEWEKLEFKELEEASKIEEACEKLVNTQPVKERLFLIRKIFKK